jgi:hypothetical protein
MTNFLIEITPWFVLWSFGGFIFLFLIPYAREANGLDEVLNPVEIYDNVDVNWFGCGLLTFLFNIACPPLTIGYWIYWLCTVGRKD